MDIHDLETPARTIGRIPSELLDLVLSDERIRHAALPNVPLRPGARGRIYVEGTIDPERYAGYEPHLTDRAEPMMRYVK